MQTSTRQKKGLPSACPVLTTLPTQHSLFNHAHFILFIRITVSPNMSSRRRRLTSSIYLNFHVSYSPSPYFWGDSVSSLMDCNPTAALWNLCYCLLDSSSTCQLLPFIFGHIFFDLLFFFNISYPTLRLSFCTRYLKKND